MARKTENNGFIIIDRRLLDWEHFAEPIVLQVFIYLLLKANYTAKWWQGYKCERGATFVTLGTMADELQLSKPTILKALQTLVDSGEIKRVKISQKHTKTIICNYTKYQGFNRFCSKTDLPQSLPQDLPQSLHKQQRITKNNNIGGNNNAHTHEDKNILTDILASPSLLESFAKNERLTAEQVTQLAEEVYIEWQLAGEDIKPTSYNKSRFLAHIRAKGQAKRDTGQLQAKPVAERKAEFLAECKALVEKGCNREKVAEFARYYTQPTADGRMLYETFKGWNTETRFLLNEKRKSS